MFSVDLKLFFAQNLHFPDILVKEPILQTFLLFKHFLIKIGFLWYWVTAKV